MQVFRRGNTLTIRLPAGLVGALALKEGYDVDVRIAPDRTQALESLRALRKPLPPGWSFDRAEANER